MSPIIKSIAIIILASMWILALRDILKQEISEDRAAHKDINPSPYTHKSRLITAAFKYTAIIGGSVAFLMFLLFWSD